MRFVFSPLSLLRSVSLMCAATMSAFVHAQSLDIPAGSTYEIGRAQADLRLEQLRIGDGATIRFAQGVESWRVYAENVELGRGVVIDGRGSEGVAGKPGRSHSGQAPECTRGREGGAGRSGGAGSDGIDLEFYWGLASLGDLKLLVGGGAGGAGGAGGSGEQGGKLRNCWGRDAGDGGAGGAGGVGGDGGDVLLSYWLKPGVSESELRRRISILNRGGAGGDGGAGGAGGFETEGRYRSGSGPGGKKWLAGGKAGASGASGRAGEAGRDGKQELQANISKVLGSSSAQRAYQSSEPKYSPAPASDIEALMRRVEALERRVRELETR